MTKYFINLSAPMDEIDSFLKLAEIFHFSAEMLYAVSGDGLNNCQGMGLTPEFFNNNFVPTVYLYRHAIELIMKALLEEIEPEDIPEKHDLRFLWDRCKATITKNGFSFVFLDDIEKDLTWLEQKGVLDDQLYRYPYSKKNKSENIHLKDQGPIDTKCIVTMGGLYLRIHEIVLSIVRVKHPNFMNTLTTTKND